MKKIIAVMMVLAMLLSFAACKNNANVEEPSDDTIASEQQSENADDSSKEDSTENTGKSTQNKTKTTSNSNVASKTTVAKTKEKTTKKETTTKETTTKRKIRLNIKFPFYDGYESMVKIEYKRAKDKKYKVLVKEEDITLDRLKTQSYDIDEKLVGDIDVRITLSGVELFENNFVVSGRDSVADIELIAGEEFIDAGFD